MVFLPVSNVYHITVQAPGYTCIYGDVTVVNGEGAASVGRKETGCLRHGPGAGDILMASFV